MEEKKNPKTASARKCLDNNYKQYKINVRNEKFAIWEQYAESKGMSMRALIIDVMEKAMENDNFLPESKTEQ